MKPVRIILVIFGLVLLTVVCGTLLLQARTSSRLSNLVTRLGPGTPVAAYANELGPPVYHFTDPDVMRSWGPRTDPALISRTEAYYFAFRGVPYSYVVVYVDRESGNAVEVMTQGM